MEKSVRSVRLEPFTEDEFGPWEERRVETYARSNVNAGFWSAAEGLAKSREAFDQLLPKGLATPDNHLWMAHDAETDEQVGTLWIAMRALGKSNEAYICFVGVDEAHQGKGYGRALMHAATDAGRQLGATSMGLNVFGDNTRAQNLYHSLGYVVQAQSMRLDL
ncbi:GNAT family N-acetyltransferase [Streptacidiphilus sp. MAP5-3]|uniref:GNAT family N-acetyltransferase n=1 Tax=unclassified Streptacidiphilus TaxID=2643834 RepID=UPI0035140419